MGNENRHKSYQSVISAFLLPFFSFSSLCLFSDFSALVSIWRSRLVGADQNGKRSRANIETPQHKLQKVLSWRSQFPKTQLPPGPIQGAHCPVQQEALPSPPGKHLCLPYQRRSCLQNLLLRCMRCCNLGHSLSGLLPLRELSKADLHSQRFFPTQLRDPFPSQHTSLSWSEDRQGRDVAQHNQSHRSLSVEQCHSCWLRSCILDV